ncbi:hypothetical protein EPN52_08585 [bacterium]|nr:MAG: hypothetical protein EPN52_08585 [bacterium]
MLRFRVLYASAIFVALCGGVATAWGARGHELISGIAAAHFSAQVPAFLHGAQAAQTIAILATEPDLIKGHDDEALTAQTSPDHYLDLADDGSVGGIALAALPPTRPEYVAALEHAGVDPYRVGFLPYAILEGYERLTKDFALYRAYRALGRGERVALRERITLQDLGEFSHFVGDGSQPLHVSVHYNDGGAHPKFEEGVVERYVTRQDVERELRPARLLPADVLPAIEAYLRTTNAAYRQVYARYHRGRFGADAGPLAAAELARGASFLDDLVYTAWVRSEDDSVGYPAVPVRSLESHAARALRL